MYGTTVHVMQRWDRGGSRLVSRFTSHAVMAAAMKALSRLGDGHLYPLLGLLLIAVDPSTLRTVIPAAALAFVLEISVQVSVKVRTRRPRPFQAATPTNLRIRPPTDFSFPSGHAAGAFIMAFYGAHLWPSGAGFCYAIASLIAISRVANGVHYPSDVIAGAILGILSAALGAEVVWQ
ncbi:phosphatase PAP2 family protein [Candidatus Fermentibacteria bacterium]|nr:phosphatase PAP2 family protein [Candidatus Fermentibacteria bacterium]